MLRIKLSKWYCLLAPLFYLIYAFTTQIYEGAGFLDYLNVIVNYGVILVVSIWLMRKSVVENNLHFVILFAFVLYLFVLHPYVTYVNIPYYFTQEYVGNHYVSMQQINLSPFKTIYNNLFGSLVAPVTVIQTVGNLFLLSPLAFALLSLKILTNKVKVALTILLTTLFIETFQFLINFSTSGYMYSEGGLRAIDIDDVLLNTAGGVLGILVFKIYKKLISPPFDNKKTVTSA